MPNPWYVSWKLSLAYCKSQSTEVHDPKSLTRNYSNTTSTAGRATSARVLYRSSCSRSIANLRDVIQSTSRRIDQTSSRSAASLPNLSPKSVESSDFIQSISHEAMLRDHGCNHGLHRHRSKLSLDDIVADHHPRPYKLSNSDSILRSSNNANVNSSFYGTPLHHSVIRSSFSSSSLYGTPLHYIAAAASANSTPSAKSRMKRISGCIDCRNPNAASMVAAFNTTPTSSASFGCRNGAAAAAMEPAGVSGRRLSSSSVAKPVCQKCGEAFAKYDELERHHLVRHAVTELEVGDSSRNVVEIIFRTSWGVCSSPAAMADSVLYSSNYNVGVISTPGRGLKILRVLKVNNLPRTLAKFEDYREGVKQRASKLPKKHARCLADGNELLRFYAARLECGLINTNQALNDDSTDMSQSSVAGAVCSSVSCTVCRIIRSGFPKARGHDGARKGIVTMATSRRAHEFMIHHRSGLSANYREEKGGLSSKYSDPKAELISNDNDNKQKLGSRGDKKRAALSSDKQSIRLRGDKQNMRLSNEKQRVGLSGEKHRSSSNIDQRHGLNADYSEERGELSANYHEQKENTAAGRTPPRRRRRSSAASLDEYHNINFNDGIGGVMAMLVCRVIAGRVHKPLENGGAVSTTSIHRSGGHPALSAGFDSVAGGDAFTAAESPPMTLHSRFEELTVFNPRAILPCFVVLYSCY